MTDQLRSSRVYLQNEGGLRLYTVAGESKDTIVAVGDALARADKHLHLEAILVYNPKLMAEQAGLETDGLEEAKIVKRDLWVDPRLVSVVEQGEDYDADQVEDQTQG